MLNNNKTNYGKVDSIIAGRFKLLKMIGKGSFGEVYCGIDLTSSTEVAIKIESTEHTFSQLLFESKVYRYLADGCNIPTARLYTMENQTKALVMELLGPSLEELFNNCRRKFSLKTVCMLADQMISLLEYIHIRYVIHRDIKPDNFLMGLGKNCNRVYVVDFGLAKQYCVSRALPHMKYNNRKFMIGTARYASINAHLGIEQSRRDDLESLGYVFLYFYLGLLPWQGLRGENKSRKYDRICEKKLNTSIETLCKRVPKEFQLYLKYCRNLRFDQRPDYTHLRALFRDLYRASNFPFDSNFDWTPISAQTVDQNGNIPNTPAAQNVNVFPQSTTPIQILKKPAPAAMPRQEYDPKDLIINTNSLEDYIQMVKNNPPTNTLKEVETLDSPPVNNKPTPNISPLQNKQKVPTQSPVLKKPAALPEKKVAPRNTLNGAVKNFKKDPDKTSIQDTNTQTSDAAHRYNLRSSKKDEVQIIENPTQPIINRFDKRRSVTTTPASNIT